MPLGGVLAVVAGVVIDVLVLVVGNMYTGAVSVVGVATVLLVVGGARREAAPAFTAALIPVSISTAHRDEKYITYF